MDAVMPLARDRRRYRAKAVVDPTAVTRPAPTATGRAMADVVLSATSCAFRSWTYAG